MAFWLDVCHLHTQPTSCAAAATAVADVDADAAVACMCACVCVDESVIWFGDTIFFCLFFFFFFRLADVAMSHTLLRAWHCLKVNYLSSFMFNFLSLFHHDFFILLTFFPFLLCAKCGIVRRARHIFITSSVSLSSRARVCVWVLALRLNCEISILHTRCKMDISCHDSYVPAYTPWRWYMGLFIFTFASDKHINQCQW